MTPSYPLVDNESDRIKKLRSLNILDSGPEAFFDQIVVEAQAAFGAPIALLSLLDEDRQWFKARVGLEVDEGAREVAFCNYTVAGGMTFEVTDASTHPIFLDNELVTGEPYVRYYLGEPIIVDGHTLGTLAVVDTQTRPKAARPNRALLARLAAAAAAEIKARAEETATHGHGQKAS